jgi:SNF2 family DNA or RNA helicase
MTKYCYNGCIESKERCYMDQFKTLPYKHQLEAYEISRDREYFALLMEQGTGKTKVIIDTAAYLYGAGRIDAVLVVAPNGVHRNWIHNEIPTHHPDWAPYQSAYWSATANKTEKQNLENLFKTGFDGLRWLSLNVEAFSSKKGLEIASSWLNCHKTLFVVDESSRIKTPTAARTKNLLKLAKHAQYRRIMTGTPVTQGPTDVFSQFLFLDENILGTSSFYAFKAEYSELLPANHGLMRHITARTGSKFTPQVIAKDKFGKPIWKNLDKLQALISPHSYRKRKVECLDLPPKVYQRVYHEMSTAQESAYKLIKNELRAQMEDGELKMLSKLEAILRLQQVVGGHRVDGTSFFEKPEQNPRIKCLMDILEEVQGGVIIWARFVAEIKEIEQMIAQEYGADAVVTYFGEVSNENRVNAVNRFQAKSARFFVGQPHSGGIGLTLTAATTVIYYSNDYSLETRLQSEDRAHRIGQAQTVTYVDVEAVNTIDKAIVAALRNKQDVASLVTGDPKLRWI